MRRRISYANVVSTLALCLAMGGTSYAAITITGKNVKNSSLTGADIKNASLTGTDIKNGSIKTADLGAGVILKGPAGPQGPQGPVGPQGPSGTSVVYETSSAEDGGTQSTNGNTLTVSQKLALPEGVYALTARAQISATQPVTVTCGVQEALDNLPSDTATVTVPVQPSSAAPTRGYAVAALQSFTGRDTTLSCSGPTSTTNGATGLQIENLTLQAVKGDKLVNG